MKYNKKTLLINTFLLSAFMTSFIPVVNIAITVLILILAVYYLKELIYKEGMILISISYIAFNYLVLILGNFILEFFTATNYKPNGIMFTGSTVRLLIYIYFFYKGFSNKTKNHVIKNEHSYINIELNEKKIKVLYKLLFVFLIVCQLIAINVIRENGIALGDRFGYERAYMNSLEVFAKWTLVKISFFIGAIYSINKKKGLILLNLISIVILKMLGVKFGEILLNLTYLVLPIAISYLSKNPFKISRKQVRRGMAVFIILMLIALSNISIVYSRAYNVSVRDGLIKTLERVSSQSVLYYFIDSDMDILSMNIDEFKNEVMVLGKLRFSLIDYLEKGNEPIGLFKLNKIYDLISYESNVKYGYSLSGGFPGIIIYYFGFLVSMPIIYFLGIILAHIYKYITIFIRKQSFVGLFLIYQMFDYIYSILILGNIYYLFRVSFIVILISMLCYILIIKHVKLRKLST